MKKISILLATVLVAAACNSKVNNTSGSSSIDPASLPPLDAGAGQISWTNGQAPDPVPALKISNLKTNDTKLSVVLDERNPDEFIISGTASGFDARDFPSSFSIKVDGFDLSLFLSENQNAKGVVDQFLVDNQGYGYVFAISDENGAQRVKLSREVDNDGKDYGRFVEHAWGVSADNTGRGRLAIFGKTTTLGWLFHAVSTVEDRTITVELIAYTNDFQRHIFEHNPFSIEVTPPKEKIFLQGDYHVIVKDRNGNVRYEQSVTIN